MDAKAVNPFSDVSSRDNPYAASSPVAAIHERGNPLFVPSLLLLIGAIFWGLYLLMAFALMLAPTGPFSDSDSSVRFMIGFSYAMMLAVNLTAIAGAIAMICQKSKWLAWTGCILGLIPMFDPCFGLTIPVAIWLLILLRRPDVDARFTS